MSLGDKELEALKQISRDKQNPPFVYLCIVTWPDGSEGLLFPRPGNVQIADTPEQGAEDFETAKRHLAEYVQELDRLCPNHTFKGCKIRLVKLAVLETIDEHPHS